MPSLIPLRRTLAFLLIALSIAGVTSGGEPKRIASSRELPIEQKPIDYFSADSDDPIARLKSRIEKEGLQLEYSDRFGYLPAILKELRIPVASQLLRTRSSGLGLDVTPQRPRAVYFDEDVVIAWFPQADHLEIAAQDSRKGTLVYTSTGSRETPPRFVGTFQNSCLACHNSQGWIDFNVAAPGHILRSFLTEDERRPYPLGHLETHNLPVELRWRSRYVTGAAPLQKHRGNEIWEDDRKAWRQVTDIKNEFDVDRYPTGTSDAVALLVYDHQRYGQNLLSRLSYEHQLNVRSKIESMAVRYLLLVDEAPLNHPTTGDSDYARWYQARGPRDPQGRSLYDLDLATRLFRHRISPLIQSRMVQGFPAELRQSLFRRLNDTLAGKEQLKGYSVSETERQATLSVLRATIPDWPAE